MSRKVGCAPAAGDDVASAYVNRSYFLVLTSWFLLPVRYEIDVLLPGSYFRLVTKKMSYKSSLQKDDRQVLREDRKENATEKHLQEGGKLNKMCTATKFHFRPPPLLRL